MDEDSCEMLSVLGRVEEGYGIKWLREEGGVVYVSNSVWYQWVRAGEENLVVVGADYFGMEDGELREFVKNLIIENESGEPTSRSSIEIMERRDGEMVSVGAKVGERYFPLVGDKLVVARVRAGEFRI